MRTGRPRQQAMVYHWQACCVAPVRIWCCLCLFGKQQPDQHHQGTGPEQERVELEYRCSCHPVIEAFHVVSSLPFWASRVAVSCPPEWRAMTAAIRAATWAATRAANEMFICYSQVLRATTESSTMKQRRMAAIKGSAARSVMRRFIGGSLVVSPLYHLVTDIAQIAHMLPRIWLTSVRLWGCSMHRQASSGLRSKSSRRCPATTCW